MTGQPEPEVTRLYAWLARDLDGAEGIITAYLPMLGVTPLVVTREALARSLAPHARRSAAARGHPAHLVAFDRAETLGTAEDITRKDPTT